MQFVELEIIWDANKKYCTNIYIWGQISHAPHFERGRSPHLEGRQPSPAHFCSNWWPAPFKLGRCAVVQDWSCEVFHQKYRYLGTMWPKQSARNAPTLFPYQPSALGQKTLSDAISEETRQWNAGGEGTPIFVKWLMRMNYINILFQIR